MGHGMAMVAAMVAAMVVAMIGAMGWLWLLLWIAASKQSQSWLTDASVR